MIGTLRTFILGLILTATASLALVTAVSSPALAAGDSKTETCQILGDISGGAANQSCEVPERRNLTSIMRLAVNLLSVVAGIIAVIAIIISGMKYITSGGDASQVSSAKRSLIYAVVGIVVAAMAQIIVRFVLAKSA